MRSPVTGSIATFLIFLPLVAVPLLAIFGMPQWPPSGPGTHGDELKFLSERDKSSPAPPAIPGDLSAGIEVSETANAAEPSGAPPAHRRREADPFAGFDRQPKTDSSRGMAASSNRTIPTGKQPQRWAGEQSSSAGEQARPDVAEAGPADRRVLGSPSDEVISDSSAAIGERGPSRSEGPATANFDFVGHTADSREAHEEVGKSGDDSQKWKAAIRRLNALGIHDYELQPGERRGEFHFSCRFASRTNPRVIQRFEAEAGEPLEAVQQVLSQIDEWRTSKSKATAASSPNANLHRVTALDVSPDARPNSSLDGVDR